MRCRPICGETYRRRLDERSQAFDIWTRRDRRVADARLVAFVAGVVLAIAIYNGLRTELVVASSFLAGSSPDSPFLTSRSAAPATEPAGRSISTPRASQDSKADGPAREYKGSIISILNTLMRPILTCLAKARSSSCCARPERGPARRRWRHGYWAPRRPKRSATANEAVAELRPRLDLREDLELLGVEVRGGIDPAALASWGQLQREFPGKTVLVVATILGALGTAAVCGWMFLGTGLLPILVVLVLDLSVLRT